MDDREAQFTGPVTYSDDSYSCLILDRLWIQRDLRNYCDVILHVDDEQYSAHRNVLAACSPYLESVLSRNEETPEHFVISCGENRIFELVLSYMYSGKITISRDNIAEILRLANFLTLSKLKEHCAEFLEQGIKRSNCFYVRDLADSNGLSVLLKTVEAFIVANILEITSHDDVLDVSESKLDFLISRSMPLTELQRVKLISRWTEHRVEDRRTRFPTLLTHILWQRVGALELCHFLRDTPLLNDNEFCMYHILQSLKDSCLLPDIYFDSLNNLRTKLFNNTSFNDDDDVASLPPLEAESDHADLDQEQKEKDSWDKASVDSESTIAFYPIEIPSSANRSLVLQSKDDVKESCGAESSSFDVPKSRIVLRNRNKVKVQEERETEAGASESQEKFQKKKVAKSRKSKQMHDENILYSDSSDKDGKKPKIPLEKASKAKVKIAFKTKSSDKQKRKRRPRGCPRLTCDLCPFSTIDPDKLKVHVNAAHQDGLKFTCNVCNFSCNWNREYYQHMKNHYPGPPHLCDRCGFSADRVQVLLVHQMDHTDERPHECKSCGMKFKLKNNLVSHMRCHSGEKPFVCPACDRSFATKGTLEQHMVTHSNQRPYLCDHCGFSTKYHSHLIAHKRLHTGDVFKCQFMNCEYSTPKRSQLACHMRCHMRIRSYTCTTCGKSFVERSHLVRHERVHLEDKPFKCDLCDYSSTRRDKLKEHCAKYHDESSAPCAAYRARKTKSQADEQSTAQAKEADKTAKKTNSKKSAKPARTAKKVSELIMRTSAQPSAVSTDGTGHQMPPQNSEAGHQLPPQRSDSGYGLLMQAAIVTDSQNLNSYAHSNLVSLPINAAYATLGLVPLQGNGFATIQLNAVPALQGAAIQPGLINVNLTGHVNNNASNGQITTNGNLSPDQPQTSDVQSNGLAIRPNSVFGSNQMNRAEQLDRSANNVNDLQGHGSTAAVNQFSNERVNEELRVAATVHNPQVGGAALSSAQSGAILNDSISSTLRVTTLPSAQATVASILDATSNSAPSTSADAVASDNLRTDGYSNDRST